MYLLETSRVFLLLVIMREKYYYIYNGLNYFYKNSHTYYFINKVLGKAKIFFLNSFLHRINGIKSGNYGIIYQGRVVMWLINLFKAAKDRIIFYFKISITQDYFLQIKRGCYFATVKIVGATIIIATLINILLTTFLNNGIGLIGWIMRGLFLAIGLLVFFCDAGWGDIKKTSLVLRHLSNLLQN